MMIIVHPGSDRCSNELVKQATSPPEVTKGVDDETSMMVLVVCGPQPEAFISPGQKAMPCTQAVSGMVQI